MTIHPAALIASIGMVLVASAATWLPQRALNRRRRTADSEDAELRRWPWLGFAYSVPLAALTWAVFTITGMIR